MGERLVELKSATFKQTLSSKIPLAVDFYADWCVPCIAVDQLIDRLAEQYRGKMTFARLNVDENQDITDRYQVISIPTLLIFLHGKAIKRFVGARKIKGCRREINQLLT
jgi:thioredoxin 1